MELDENSWQELSEVRDVIDAVTCLRKWDQIREPGPPLTAGPPLLILLQWDQFIPVFVPCDLQDFFFCCAWWGCQGHHSGVPPIELWCRSTCI